MMTSATNAGPLATVIDIAGAPRLQLRHLSRRGSRPVLYIHGGTFPSALSVGYRFADGISWEDDLNAAGYDVWALDFEGFGASARPASFAKPADASAIPLRSMEAAQQIARAVNTIREVTGRDQVSLLAHSWGCVPAARYATDHANALQQLVLFAPVLQRPTPARPYPIINNFPDPMRMPAWRLLSVAEQLARFVHDIPGGHTSVLAEPRLDRWGPAWLATDANATARTPQAVQVPTGPQADIIALWRGASLYNPAAITTPTFVVRGEWDSVCTAADVERFAASATSARPATHVIPISGHLAHLEINRALLWSATSDFLREGSR
jgi:pimeloyl-ACP methyl ester carboxylesterase